MSERTRVAIAEIVEDHLSRYRPDDSTSALVFMGMGQIGEVLAEVQRGEGNYAAMSQRLREGQRAIDHGLAKAADHSLVRFARAQAAFAGQLADDIERISAGDSTLV